MGIPVRMWLHTVRRKRWIQLKTDHHPEFKITIKLNNNNNTKKKKKLYEFDLFFCVGYEKKSRGENFKRRIISAGLTSANQSVRSLTSPSRCGWVEGEGQGKNFDIFLFGCRLLRPALSWNGGVDAQSHSGVKRSKTTAHIVVWPILEPSIQMPISHNCVQFVPLPFCWCQETLKESHRTNHRSVWLIIQKWLAWIVYLNGDDPMI